MNLIISYECSDCSAGNFESNSIWLKSVPFIHSRRSHKAIYMSRSKDLILIRLSEMYFQDVYCFTLPENQKGMICFTILGNVNLYMMGNPLPPLPLKSMKIKPPCHKLYWFYSIGHFLVHKKSVNSPVSIGSQHWKRRRHPACPLGFFLWSL